MEQIECSETSAYKIQTPGNYPEENIRQEYKCLFSNSHSDILVEMYLTFTMNRTNMEK
jgi:hypothetical protein